MEEIRLFVMSAMVLLVYVSMIVVFFVMRPVPQPIAPFFVQRSQVRA